jgi:hypothetical protein
MKIHLGRLKQLIRELAEKELDQVKLGIASAHPPGEAWGIGLDEPEEEMASMASEDGPTYIATVATDFDPGEDVKAMYRRKHVYDMAGDPIDVDDDIKPMTSGDSRAPRLPDARYARRAGRAR